MNEWMSEWMMTRSHQNLIPGFLSLWAVFSLPEIVNIISLVWQFALQHFTINNVTYIPTRKLTLIYIWWHLNCFRSTGSETNSPSSYLKCFRYHYQNLYEDPLISIRHVRNTFSSVKWVVINIEGWLENHQTGAPLQTWGIKIWANHHLHGPLS